MTSCEQCGFLSSGPRTVCVNCGHSFVASAEPPVAVEAIAAPEVTFGEFYKPSAPASEGSAPHLGEVAGLAGGVVAWTKLVHCGPHGADLMKTGGVDRIWDAGAVSAIALKSGDGYLEFTASETTTSRMCGLSGHADPAHFHLVEYAFLLSWNGSAEVYEQGHSTGVSTSYVTGAEFRISLEQGKVNYYKNGELLFTSGHKPLHRLLAVAAFWSRNATIRDAAMYGEMLARATAEQTSYAPAVREPLLHSGAGTYAVAHPEPPASAAHPTLPPVERHYEPPAPAPAAQPERASAPRPKTRTRSGSVLVARSRTLGLAGASALFAGVFAPSIGGLVIGTRSYFQYVQLEASILILLAGASYVLVLLRAYSRLWLTGLAALGILATTLVVFSARVSEAKAHTRRWIEDNPFQGYSEPVLDTIQLQWGWMMLLAGALLLLSAAFFSRR